MGNTLTIKKILSKEDLVENLRSIPNFPQYLSLNWDSIEECLLDYIEPNAEEFTIINEQTFVFLEKNLPQYKKILDEIQINYPLVRILFSDI
jgi:hypothetical protein